LAADAVATHLSHRRLLRAARRRHLHRPTSVRAPGPPLRALDVPARAPGVPRPGNGAHRCRLSAALGALSLARPPVPLLQRRDLRRDLDPLLLLQPAEVPAPGGRGAGAGAQRAPAYEPTPLLWRRRGAGARLSHRRLRPRGPAVAHRRPRRAGSRESSLAPGVGPWRKEPPAALPQLGGAIRRERRAIRVKDRALCVPGVALRRGPPAAPRRR